MRTIRSASAAGAAALATAFYFFGPVMTPLMHGAALKTCNDLAGGNYRSFRLTWQVSSHPHWSCWDASKPMKPTVNLGWWVSGR